MNKVIIKNRKNQSIAAVVNENIDSKGLAFIMHGLGGFKEQPHVRAMAEVFEKADCTTVLFDATNSIGESDGRYEDATMQNYYEDFEDVISWSKAQIWYQQPFYIAGHSLGGYSVLRFAEENPELVKGVFAWAPVISGKFSFEATERIGEIEQWEKTGWKIRISNSKPGLELRLPWSHMLERQNHDLFPRVENLTMPLAIIVGDEDTSCPLDQQEKFFAAIPENKKDLYIIKGAQHTFREESHLTQLKEKLAQWLTNS